MTANDEILYLTALGEVKSLRVNQYPDGMPMVPHAIGFRQKIVRVLLRPSSMQAFVAAMFWIDALAERGYDIPDLILPFVPGARQDRLNDAGDFLFTAKSVAKMINARRFPRVTIVDPHSEVTPGLIDRCEVVPAAWCFPKQSYAAVIAPDAGAEKRALGVATKLEVQLYHAWKRRNISTGAISGFGVEPLPVGIGRVLVVDDICDGGGTFLGLAGQLGTMTADLFVTHGIFSQGTAPLLSRFGTVYTTDSILGAPRDGVTVIPCCERLLTEEETPT